MQAMKCLVQIVSVRRTLFITEEERHTFLCNLMYMMIDLVKNNTGTLSTAFYRMITSSTDKAESSCRI